MPTDDKRKKRRAAKGTQRVIKRYQKAREDVQVAGIIPTVPDGAARSEVVDPMSQQDPTLPGLVARAVRSGWATPEDKKPDIVDGLIKVALDDCPLLIRERIAAARTLAQIDRDQWERDNPDRAGQTRGGVKVGVQVNNNQQPQVDLLALAREQMARDPLAEAMENDDGDARTGAVDSGGGPAGPQAPEDEAGGPVRVGDEQDRTEA